MVGGFSQMEKEHKAGWRKHLDAQHVSRTKWIIEGIRFYKDDKYLETQAAISELEPIFQEEGRSIAKMVRRMQSEGWLQTREPRAKKGNANQ